MSGLGIIEGFGANLRIFTDTMVVATSVGIAAVESVASDTIFPGTIANSSSETRYAAIGNVVGSFTTQKEALMTKNCINCKSRTLKAI